MVSLFHRALRPHRLPIAVIKIVPIKRSYLALPCKNLEQIALLVTYLCQFD